MFMPANLILQGTISLFLYWLKFMFKYISILIKCKTEKIQTIELKFILFSAYLNFHDSLKNFLTN